MYALHRLSRSILQKNLRTSSNLRHARYTAISQPIRQNSSSIINLPNGSIQYNLPSDEIPEEHNSIVLTERAIKMLDEKLYDHEHLRIGIDSGGCVGFKYEFDIVEDYDEEVDLEFRGKKGVVVAKEFIDLVDGATVDFEVNMMKNGFIVAKNPNADDNCSCGASFSTSDLTI